MKKSIILHSDSLSVLDELSNEQSGILFKAIHTFMNGQEPELDFAMKMCFLPFRNQFLRDLEKYERKCEANRKNGLNGGRPRKTEKTEMVSDEPNETESNRKNHDSDNKKDNKKDNKNKNETFEISFDVFWNIFDKKVDKVKCFNIWKKIKPEQHEEIILIAKKYVDATPDVKFRKNPLTWLNGQCWNDEIEVKNKPLISTKYIPTI
jgi:hypothetical protein